MTKKTQKKEPKKSSKKKYPWRKVQGRWTDTLFNKKLLDNPSLMTSKELANALMEYNAWRQSKGKYMCVNDPFEEGVEVDPPFSPAVLGRLIGEAYVRLFIANNLVMGRFK